MKKNKIFIISGTLGAGKSTVSKLLAKQLNTSVLIETDVFLNMLQNDEVPAWENRLQFMWESTIAVAKNAVSLDLNVVIDGVVEEEFPMLLQAFEGHETHYHILIADEETLVKRITDRGDTEYVQRSMDVLQSFKKDPLKAPYFVDTSHHNPQEVLDIVIKS